MKRKLSHWVPTFFCAFLCTMALVGGVVAAAQGVDSGWWKPAFYAFLPMCFFFVGTVTVDMQRQIRELKDQLDRREGARS